VAVAVEREKLLSAELEGALIRAAEAEAEAGERVAEAEERARSAVGAAAEQSGHATHAAAQRLEVLEKAEAERLKAAEVCVLSSNPLPSVSDTNS
jgi:hypothetical protein